MMSDAYLPKKSRLMDDIDGEDEEEGEDVCCYCGDDDTDKIAMSGNEDKKKFKGDRCHSFCEEENYED